MSIKLYESYSTPKVNKDNPDKWYVYFNMAVPEELKKFTDDFPRGTKRFKIYKGINSKKGEEREAFAKEVCEVIETALKMGVYNPFSKYLKAIDAATKQIRKEKQTASLPEEVTRKMTPVAKALELFIESRKARKVDQKTIITYQNTVTWLSEGLPLIKINDIKYTHVSQAMDKAVLARKWSATTINKEWEFASTIFSWLTLEEYVFPNPIKGKIVKLKTAVTKHKWYDRNTARRVKKALDEGPAWLKQVCQFTYWTLIRSKEELQSIKVGDIDFDLQQINFRKEWAKNDSDQNRDYGPEFVKVLDEMNLKHLPKEWYIFGNKGVPGPKKCSSNFFSNAWAKVRNGLGLSSDYTIYGWKHTRIVHMMMLNHTSYEISHAARHSNVKTTDDYKKDYDISLNKVYKPEDLTF